MNKRSSIRALSAVSIVASVLLSAGAAAQERVSTVPRLTKEKLERIEDNLLLALGRDDVPGIQASGALVLREVKRIAPDYGFARSTVPLMRIVKSERFDRVRRIAAALALYDLQSNIGDYAIMRTGEFTANADVRHICQALTAERRQSNKPTGELER